MATLKFSAVEALMIEDDLILSVLAGISFKGALVTTISKTGNVQTRVLLYFEKDNPYWKDLEP